MSCEKRSHSLRKIVVPGIYASKRRDYFGLLSYLKDNWSTLRERYGEFEIELLGRPDSSDDGERILKAIKCAQDSGVALKFHQVYVEESYVNMAVEESIGILSPINKIREDGEIYGITKDTGAFWDMLKYGKQGVVPSTLAIPSFADQFARSFVDYQEAFELLLSERSDSPSGYGKEELESYKSEFILNFKACIDEVINDA